jgi:hypothetical protein
MVFAQAARLRILNDAAFLPLKIYACGKFSIRYAEPEEKRHLMRILVETRVLNAASPVCMQKCGW